jgi:hypothetical protein
VAASGRQYTSQTTCRWHPIATGVVRHIEVLKTAGGSESVSTLSRPEWPSWPFSPSAWMQESSELLPATGPRAARGRADAAEAAGCTVVATAKLAPLSLKIHPPPPPIFYPTTCSNVKEIRPLANHTGFVSGRFLAEKTYLVGYWKLRILRKDEVRNR